MSEKVSSDLKVVQALWSRKLSAWYDERRPYVRVQLYKEIRELEFQIQEIKRGQVKK